MEDIGSSSPSGLLSAVVSSLPHSHQKKKLLFCTQSRETTGFKASAESFHISGTLRRKKKSHFAFVSLFISQGLHIKKYKVSCKGGCTTKKKQKRHVFIRFIFQNVIGHLCFLQEQISLC